MLESSVDKAPLLSVPELGLGPESGDETHIAMNFFFSKQGHDTPLFKKMHLGRNLCSFYSQL